MSYKVLNEDEKSFQVQHPDGSTFTVAKQGLGKGLVDKIKGMYQPSFADGGEVDEALVEDVGSRAYDRLATLGEGVRKIFYNPEATDELGQLAKKTLVEPSAPVAAPVSEQINQAQPQVEPQVSQPVQPAPEVSMPPAKAQITAPYLDQALGMQQSGLNKMAEGQTRQAEAEARLLQEAADQQQMAADTFKMKMVDLDKQMEQQQRDILDSKVDPNRYFSSMSVGSKIGAALSVALGGIGQGLMRSNTNPAMDLLLRFQNQDIDKQKIEMDKKRNALSLNMQRYQNLQAAEAATRLQQAAVVQSKLQQIAAQNKSPIIQGQIQQMQGQMLQQIAPLKFELAKFEAAQQMMRQAQAQKGTGSNGAQVIRALGMTGQMTPEQQNKAFDELTEMQKLTKFRDNVLSGFDKIAKLQTAGERLSNPLQSARQIEAIIATLNSELSKELAGKFTEFENENLSSVMPKLTDSPKTVAAKRANLLKIVSQKMNSSLLDGYGIPYPQGRYGVGGGETIKMGPPK